jgi:predicted metal-dependent HD superfamily phosphohydrolase
VESKLAALKEKPIIKSAFALLRDKLPKTLQYHNFEHTEEVLNEALLFATEDKLDDRSLELLAVAAAYHDSGFIKAAKENEALGARYAEVAMEKAGGYTDVERRKVITMILDTQLHFTPEGPKQTPTIPLSCYLCDADVSNLGRDDFFDKAELVRLEAGSPPQKEFLKGLLTFLSCHEWFTPAATCLRGPKRDQNLEEVKRRLAALK